MKLLHSVLVAASIVRAAVITITVAPPIPSGEPSYSKHYVFTSAVLNSTNTYRRQHNASSLRWNATLASFATNYLKSIKDCAFEHSGGPYGENIAIGYGNATAAVEAWGDERVKYNFEKSEFTEGTGHFTQLVWRNTSTVGCGCTLCGHRGWFLACEYWPRGNVVGAFRDQVERRVNSSAKEAAVRPVYMVLVVLGLYLAIL